MVTSRFEGTSQRGQVHKHYVCSYLAEGGIGWVGGGREEPLTDEFASSDLYSTSWIFTACRITFARYVNSYHEQSLTVMDNPWRELAFITTV